MDTDQAKVMLLFLNNVLFRLNHSGWASVLPMLLLQDSLQKIIRVVQLSTPSSAVVSRVLNAARRPAVLVSSMRQFGRYLPED